MINELSIKFHEQSNSKGFFVENHEKGTALMLVVTELSEALESDRKGKYCKISSKELQEFKEHSDTTFKILFEHNIKDTFQDELADCFIRLIDMIGAYQIDIDSHIELKMRYNKMREHKHGKAY